MLVFKYLNMLSSKVNKCQTTEANYLIPNFKIPQCYSLIYA